MPVHLIKLCVGAETVSDLTEWQDEVMAHNAARGLPRLPTHVTRMWPKRAEEVLAGGSLYWVFKGLVLCRQRVLSLDAVTGEDGIERCAITLDPDAIRTVPQPRRPFQGWRYLRPEDAPRDLGAGSDAADLPPTLARELAGLGVL